MEELRHVADLIDGDLTRDLYREHGTISTGTIEGRCGGWVAALKAAGVYDGRLERWEEALRETRGRFTGTELQSYLNEQSDANTTFNSAEHIYDLIEFVNERGNGLTMTRREVRTGTRIYVKNTEIDRYAEYKDAIPDQHHHVFMEFVNYGQNPKSIAAAIRWLTSDKSQREAAYEFGVTTQVVGKKADDVAEELGVDPEAAKQ